MNLRRPLFAVLAFLLSAPALYARRIRIPIIYTKKSSSSSESSSTVAENSSSSTATAEPSVEYNLEETACYAAPALLLIFLIAHYLPKLIDAWQERQQKRLFSSIDPEQHCFFRTDRQTTHADAGNAPAGALLALYNNAVLPPQTEVCWDGNENYLPIEQAPVIRLEHKRRRLLISSLCFNNTFRALFRVVSLVVIVLASIMIFVEKPAAYSPLMNIVIGIGTVLGLTLALLCGSLISGIAGWFSVMPGHRFRASLVRAYAAGMLASCLCSVLLMFFVCGFNTPAHIGEIVLMVLASGCALGILLCVFLLSAAKINLLTGRDLS